MTSHHVHDAILLAAPVCTNIHKIILSGEKDPATDLWTLPLGSNGMTSHHVHDAILLAAPLCTNAHAYLSMQITFSTHTVQTKAK
jgi:hypothetical protein